MPLTQVMHAGVAVTEASQSMWDCGRATPSAASVGGTSTGLGWRRSGVCDDWGPAGEGERMKLSRRHERARSGRCEAPPAHPCSARSAALMIPLPCNNVREDHATQSDCRSAPQNAIQCGRTTIKAKGISVRPWASTMASG